MSAPIHAGFPLPPTASRGYGFDVADYLKRRIKSFGHALNGLRLLIACGPNMHICLTAVPLVTTAGFYFGLNAVEWALIVLCFALVIAIETLNTALERLADRVHPDRHPEIGKAKDLAAGAALIVAIGSAIVGILIFWPHLLARLT